MEKYPKVTVIIPTFNVKPYLTECVNSVLNQSLQDLEILCGDGGSTDGSLQLLQEYAAKDDRIKIISKKGSGYGKSINDCMDMAKGDYIGIVESDDVIKSDMLETLYRIASKQNLDWVRGDVYFYYPSAPEKQQLVRESIIYGRDFYNQVLNPQKDCRPYYSGLRTWSGIYKRSFLNHYNIRHNETPGASFQDVGFYLKTLYYAQRVSFVDQAFYMWRQDNMDSSIHYDSKKLVEKSLNEWKLNWEYLESHLDLGLLARAGYHYRKFFSYLWTRDMAQGDDKNLVKEKGIQEFSAAMQAGELDPAFFGTEDWNRLMEFVQPYPESSAQVPSPSFSMKFKRIIVYFLRPLADFLRKIIHKLFRDVLAHMEAEIHSAMAREAENIAALENKILEIRTNINAFSTQQEVVVSLSESILSLARQLDISVGRLTAISDDVGTQFMATQMQIETIKRKISDQGQILWSVKTRLEDVHRKTEDTVQKAFDQGEVLWSVKSRLEDVHKRTEDTGQRVHDQGEVLWSVKTRLEDVHKRTEDTGQRVHDEGEVLWSVKTRLEDVHKRTEDTGQKVYDQGQVLWSVKTRVEDIFNTSRRANDDQLWMIYSLLHRKQTDKLIGQSDIYDSMFYLKNQYRSICSSQAILYQLFKKLPHESVVDFGCGTGTWLYVAKNYGATEILGLDGNYVPRPLLMISEENFRPTDLEKPIFFDRRYDLAISLEVGEHLAAESAGIFVKSLCDSSDIILFSAAHPGQGGDNHINEQPASYWIEKFAAYGYDMVEIKRQFAENPKVELWYRENLMLFVKQGTSAMTIFSEKRSLIHDYHQNAIPG